MTDLVWGATAMACVVVGGFFVRFWLRSRDLLFLLFALGFFMLAVNWFGLGMANVTGEARHWPFIIVRLTAFLLFLGAILQKNLRK